MDSIKDKVNHIGNETLSSAKKIVVKVGSSLLIEEKYGSIRKQWFASFINDIVNLKKKNKKIIIVSSGAINLGRKILNLRDRALTLEEKQAAASVGQIELAKEYQQHFKKNKLISSQILMTLDDTTNRRRYLNCRSTLNTLINFGVVPIVNENDTVATDEIRYGDNDRLAAQVASICDCDLLVLLSDIDGFYTKSPKKHKDAEHIPLITKITKELELMAEDAESEYSNGGMKTKLEAGKIAISVGCNMVITSGLRNNPIGEMNLSNSTWFMASKSVKAARKKWILNMKSMGEIEIDENAKKALQAGKSLLPVGTISCQGSFNRGDVVIIKSKDNNVLAKGLVSYNHLETKKIIGLKSADIAETLGYNGRSVIVHRDDMAFYKE